MRDLDIKSIVAPRLSIPGYGKGVDDAFKAIEENFKIIANHDFIKGDRGYSLQVSDLPILDDDHKFTEIGIALMDNILSTILYEGESLTFEKFCVLLGVETTDTFEKIRTKLNNTSFPDDLKGLTSVPYDDGANHYSFIDNLYSESNEVSFKVVEWYDPSALVKDPKPKASLNLYIYNDRRFSNEKLGNADEKFINQYSGLLDLSKVIYLKSIDVSDDSSSVKYQMDSINSIPCLYYDSTTEAFCWKLNGEKTGMIAQGVPGKDGTSATSYVLRVGEKVQSAGLYTVSKILRPYVNDESEDNEYGWDTITEDDIDKLKGITCMIIGDVSSDSAASTAEVFFSPVIKIEKEDGNAIAEVYCNRKGDNSNCLNVNIAHSLFGETMANWIGPDKEKPIKGLSVPYNSSNSDSYRHMLWSEKDSASDTNYEKCRLAPVYYKKLKHILEGGKPADLKTSTGTQDSWALFHYDGQLNLDYDKVVIGIPKMDAYGYETNDVGSKIIFENSQSNGKAALTIGSTTTSSPSWSKLSNNQLYINRDNQWLSLDLRDLPAADEYYPVIKSSKYPLSVNTGSSTIANGGRLIVGSLDNNDGLYSHLRFADNEIQSYNGSTAVKLTLNPIGGAVIISNDAQIGGSLQVSNNTIIKGSGSFGQSITTGRDTEYATLSNSSLTFYQEDSSQESKILSLNNPIYIDSPNIQLDCVDSTTSSQVFETKYNGDLTINAKNINANSTLRVSDGIVLGHNAKDGYTHNNLHKRIKLTTNLIELTTPYYYVYAGIESSYIERKYNEFLLYGAAGIYKVDTFQETVVSKVPSINPDSSTRYQCSYYNFTPGSVIIYDHLVKWMILNGKDENPQTTFNIFFTSAASAVDSTWLNTSLSVKKSDFYTESVGKSNYLRIRGTLVIGGAESNKKNYVTLLTKPTIEIITVDEWNELTGSTDSGEKSGDESG